MTKFINGRDHFNDWLGRGVAWATLAMVVVGVVVVVLRYGFNLGWVGLQEAVLWLNGILILLGAAYALRHDAHVRVDVIYRRLGERGRAWIDLLGTLLLLWPLCGVLLWQCFDYVLASWRIGEGSQEAGGLPGVFVFKTLLLCLPVLLALQGLVVCLRSTRTLMGRQNS